VSRNITSRKGTNVVLKNTGHPLVDVGVATILSFVGKIEPSQVTESDLDTVADYIEHHYTRPPLIGFIHGAIFPNSGYTNPGIRGDRAPYITPYLYAYRDQSTDTRDQCGFCGRPAVRRVARDHFPLLSGRGVINFYPWGDAGLPICGFCLLAVQAYFLGSGAFLLAVHSDNEALTYHFARSFLEDNRRGIQLAELAGEKKPRRNPLASRTLLITTLLEADLMQKEERDLQQPFSVTAYSLSNSGQSPSLEIFHLPLQIVRFLRDMRSAEYRYDWETIVSRAWEVAPQKKKARTDANPFQPRRNYLYEDLFKLQQPREPGRFVRTYLLRDAWRFARSDQGDPRGSYSLTNDAELVSWKITERFLRRVMNMEKARVEQIRNMGDRLADYINSQNDKRFFRSFFTEQRYGFFRNALLKANLAHVQRGNPPIITLDPYILVFEEGDEVERPDWRFARDLVLIRMVERLHESGWLRHNDDVVAETVEAASAEEAESS
jgi:CRISPR-associated protein Cst1